MSHLPPPHTGESSEAWMPVSGFWGSWAQNRPGFPELGFCVGWNFVLRKMFLAANHKPPNSNSCLAKVAQRSRGLFLLILTWRVTLLSPLSAPASTAVKCQHPTEVTLCSEVIHRVDVGWDAEFQHVHHSCTPRCSLQLSKHLTGKSSKEINKTL